MTETDPSLVAANTGFGSAGGMSDGIAASTVHAVAGGGADERHPAHAANSTAAIASLSSLVPTIYLPTSSRAASRSGRPASRMRAWAAATSYSSLRKRTVREPVSYITYDARGSPSRG